MKNTSFSYPFPIQEKEKKNVSSLVEAALDEESDSEDEMEVSFTKVGCQLVITDQPLLMMFFHMLDFWYSTKIISKTESKLAYLVQDFSTC